jgi:acetate---CoA ligase (ADP-forming)
MTAVRGLSSLFDPASVAVIGASDNPERIGGRVLRHLKDHYAGPAYPVNAARDVVQGLLAYPSVTALPEPPDFAVIAVPAADVVGVIEACGHKGVGAALILSAGFAETGDAGRAEQDRIRDVARSTGMRVVGPNCVGIISLPRGLIGTFATADLSGGAAAGLAIVSQSGALGMTFWNQCHRLGLGASYLCTTGNEADVTAAEAVGYLIERPDVSAVMLFLEGLNQPAELFAAGTRALELGKPIVAMKAGVSGQGARAAISHTGSIAIPDKLVGSLLERAGIVRVHSPTDLVYFSSTFAAGRFPAGDRIGVMTGSGGVGVMISDQAEALGLTLPSPSPDAMRRIRERIPPFGSARNPVDYTANIVNDPAGFGAVLEAVVSDGQFDGICIAGTPAATARQMCQAIEDKYAVSAKPILVCSTDRQIVRLLTSHGIPAFDDAVLMTRAMGHLRAYARRRSQERAEPPLLDTAGPRPGTPSVLAAAEARALLQGYAIPLVPEVSATGADEAAAAAEELGYPVAVKLNSSVAAHKSDIGGLRLGLCTGEETRAAVADLAAAAPGGGGPGRLPVVVQRMVPAGPELFVGGMRHPVLGPAVIVGLGGSLIEILDQSAVGLVPLSQVSAGRLVASLCDGRLVTADRGLSPAQHGSLLQVMVAVSRLLADRPDVSEVDLNPLIAGLDGVTAVDALVTVMAER